ncbi:MAG: DUF4838 domain-containing protein [Lentisphaerae bacterium]|nr:DUF4838 domain-containing protein [Lentisphaerota bacterium]
MKRLLLAFFLSASTASFAQIKLGETDLTGIVVPANSADSVKLAGRELQTFIGQVCGKRLEIVDKAEGCGNIILGEQPDLLRNVREDGFIIKDKGGNLYISGRDQKGVVYGIRNPWNRHEVYNGKLKLGAFGESGTLYGVYAFLEKFAGIRFYMPGEIGTVIPKKSIVIPAGIEFGNNPKFAYRHPWFCNFDVAPEDALWYKRAGFGGKAPVQIIDYFQYFTRQLKKSNPEYFAMVNGQRDFGNKCAIRGGGHLCFNAPGCKETVAELIKDYFRKHPEQRYFPLTPNDGLVRCCECPQCRAEQDMDKPGYAKFSNHVWKFVNEVAKLVEKEFPDHFVGCLAYDTYLAPPDRIAKLNRNVAVMFCRNRGNMASKAYADAMHRRIEEWQTKTDNRLFGWDYYLHCWIPWRELPVFFPQIIQSDLQYMLRHGFAGEFIEAESWRSRAMPKKMNYPATQHLNLYLTGKLYWDPDADVNALLDEYYCLFYGPAEKPMREFHMLAIKCWNDGMKSRTSTSGISEAAKPSDIFPIAALDKMLGLIDKSRRLAVRSPYKERVQLMANEFAHGRRTLVAMVRSSMPELVSLKTNEKMVIDGILDEETWSHGQGSPMVTKMGETTPHRTFIYSRHDSRNLYFGFILHESKPDKLKISARGRDPKGIYEDDCMEIYLRNRNGRNYQFIISPGGLWDAEIDALRSRNAEWNSDAKYAVKISGKRICMEIAIPKASVGIAEDESLKANFYRSRVVDEGQTFSVWSPVFEERHYKPENFGTILLKP